jgi:hypothetical protein
VRVVFVQHRRAALGRKLRGQLELEHDGRPPRRLVQFERSTAGVLLRRDGVRRQRRRNLERVVVLFETDGSARPVDVWSDLHVGHRHGGNAAGVRNVDGQLGRNVYGQHDHVG